MRRITLIFSLVLFAYSSYAQVALATRVLKDSLFIPWEIIYGPDDHIWFTQKNGYICRMDTAGTHTDTLLHEPATITIRESGMLGMALHPEFNKQPYVYIVWEFLRLPDSAIRERVTRYTYNTTSNTLSTPFILLDSIEGYRFHNGCRLQIVEDKLFMTIADAADSTYPQNLSKINGKILRINLDGTIPSDNPVAGSPIWSWGHRNAQGLVFANGILYSSEHGANSDDELNIIYKGGNYGWPYVRGYCDKSWETAFCSDSNFTAPAHVWNAPTVAPCGIDYYNHALFPTLRNSLLMTTLKDKHLYQLRLNGDGTKVIDATIIAGIDYGRLRDICISPGGKIFLSTSNSNADGKPPFIDKIIEVYNPVISENRAQELIIYPNPANDYIYLVLPAANQQLEYTLSNTIGQTIGSGVLNSHQSRIYIGTLPAGMYDITFYDNGHPLYRGKFVHLH